MLRLGDLKALTVSDIVDNMGNVKITFPWRQQKRKGGVYPVLTLKTRQFPRSMDQSVRENRSRYFVHLIEARKSQRQAF